MTLRYKLRTLLIVLALGPPVLAAGYAALCEVGRGEAVMGAALYVGLMAVGGGLVAANAKSRGWR
jgi:hypothetical protein